MEREQDLLATAIQRVETALLDEKERISAEIHAYPPPIPACDAQFNYLLERRDQVSVELTRLHAISEGRHTAAELADALRDFLAASQSIDPPLKGEVGAYLNT